MHRDGSTNFTKPLFWSVDWSPLKNNKQKHDVNYQGRHECIDNLMRIMRLDIVMLT